MTDKLLHTLSDEQLTNMAHAYATLANSCQNHVGLVGELLPQHTPVALYTELQRRTKATRATTRRAMLLHALYQLLCQFQGYPFCTIDNSRWLLTNIASLADRIIDKYTPYIPQHTTEIPAAELLLLLDDLHACEDPLPEELSLLRTSLSSNCHYALL